MARPTRLLVLFVLCASFTAHAAPPDTLPEGGHGNVAVVMDGDSLRLEGMNTDVRLLGLQAPKLPKGRRNFKAWPEGEDAKHALESLVKGHAITLRLGTTPRDRNGRILAQAVRDDGLWIQQELVREGWARVYTFADNRQFAHDLLAAEAEARAAHRGLWADALYAVRASEPAALAKDVGTFQIVEGKVKNAAKVKGRVYLNFGSDFREDFTASIAPDVLRLFTQAHIDPLSFQGKTIRVRGYVRTFNGPAMDITHPEEIEAVEAP